jgi:hypothetical protein
VAEVESLSEQLAEARADLQKMKLESSAQLQAALSQLAEKVSRDPPLSAPWLADRILFSLQDHRIATLESELKTSETAKVSDLLPLCPHWSFETFLQQSALEGLSLLQQALAEKVVSSLILSSHISATH